MLKPAVVIALAALAVATPAGAQRALAAPKPATVEGDVYLMTKAGDTRRGAGRVVLLLSDDDGLLKSRVLVPCANALVRTNELTRWEAALLDTEKLIRNGRPGLPDIYDVLSREQRIVRGIAAINIEMRDSIMRVIAKSIVDSAGSGMNAHYRFSIAKPGRYVAFSDWSLGDHE